MLGHPAADVATGTAHTSFSNTARPAVPSAQLFVEGGSSSQFAQTRKSSRREDSTSSDFFTTSIDGEISSGQLFVKIPSIDTHSARSPRSSARPEETLPARPPRSALRTQPFPEQEEDDSDDGFLPIQKPWTSRPRTLSSGEPASRRVIESGRGRQACSEDGEPRRGQRPRVLSLPRQAFRTGSNSDSSEQPSPLTPSAFNDIPPMPIFARNRRYRHQPRDSGVTHQSTTSSSLYPRSTSTGESYMSPPSLPPNDIDDRHIITVDPEENPHEDELHEMDADDVSYRLRLLMQNNYYLPPAHSKPFNDYPFPETPKKSPSKQSSPNFLDLFKMGKRKASTPDSKAAKGTSAPILRTTSDQSTVSGIGRPRAVSRPAQPHPHAMAMTMAPHALAVPQQQRPDLPSKGRVVVVRERMEDIATVARQVEQDLKIKQRVAEAERRLRRSEISHTTEEVPINEGLIDPTDSVDLPPVTANALFGPQASALNNMGVEASLGAAALADRLVPASPGMWSVDSEEASWRKALLQEAVGHSLNNSPAVTPARGTPSGSSPFLATELPTTPSPAPLSPAVRASSSPRPGGSPAPILLENSNGEAPLPGNSVIANARSSGAVPRRKRELGQRIISHMIDDADLEAAMPPAAPLSPTGATGLGVEPLSANSAGDTRSLRVSSAGSYVPMRAETPTAPPTPLTPAPRRPNVTPSHSSDSAENGPKSSMETVAAGPSSNVQLQVSTAQISRLSDVYESQAFGDITPPPDSLGSQNNSVTLSAIRPPGITISSRSPSLSSSSRYSSYDEQDHTAFHTPMEHTMASFDGSRPSLTVSSVRSSSEYSQQSPTTSAFRDAFDHSPFRDHSPGRQSVTNTLGGRSRGSSRTSNHEDPHYSVVSPPPRTSSSLAHTALHPPPRRPYIPMPHPFDHISERSPSLHDYEDEPMTPTNRLHVPASLHMSIPGGDIPAYPPSPISFFDAVEMQSGAEEDDSDEEEGEGEDGDEDDDEEEEEQIIEAPEEDPTEQVDEYQSDAEAGIVIVNPVTGSVGNLARDPKLPLAGVAQTSNFSTPQMAPASLPSGGSYRETSSTLVHETLDTRLPIPGPPPSASSRSTFSLKNKGKAPFAQLPPNPPRISESMVERMRPKPSSRADDAKRPATASAAINRRTEAPGVQNVREWQEEQSQQDATTRRLDGMLIEHMERERDILRRITTTLTKP